MKKLKNWIIKKLGGYTYDEYISLNEIRDSMPKIEAIQLDYSTLKVTRIVPNIPTIYAQQDIAREFGISLLKNNLIKWSIKDDEICGIIRVINP